MYLKSPRQLTQLVKYETQAVTKERYTHHLAFLSQNCYKFMTSLFSRKQRNEQVLSNKKLNISLASKLPSTTLLPLFWGPKLFPVLVRTSPVLESSCVLLHFSLMCMEKFIALSLYSVLQVVANTDHFKSLPIRILFYIVL